MLLYGRGSHLAWDVGEVLHAVQPFGDHLLDELGPVLAGLDAENGVIFFIHNSFDALVVHEDDDAVEDFLCEKDIVTAAEDKDILVL